MERCNQLDNLRKIYCSSIKWRKDKAVISENIKVGERTLIMHKSDNNKFIRQVETGVEYVSAVDVIPCRYTYEETDKDIPKRPEEEKDEA